MGGMGKHTNCLFKIFFFVWSGLKKVNLQAYIEMRRHVVWDYPLQICPKHYYLKADLTGNLVSMCICSAQNTSSYVQGQGHTLRSNVIKELAQSITLPLVVEI